MAKNSLNSSNLLTSFSLTLLFGIFLRMFFQFYNGASLSLEVLEPLLVGLIIDGAMVSFFFLPLCFFFLLKLTNFLRRLQTFYLSTVISLFLLLAIVDIFFFQIFYDRLHIHAIYKMLANAPMSVLLSIQYEYPLAFLVFPCTGVLVWIIQKPSLEFARLYQVISCLFVSKRLKVFLNKKARLVIFLFHFLFFYLISFVYIDPISFFKPLIYNSSDKLVLQASAKNATYNLISSYFNLSYLDSPFFLRTTEYLFTQPPSDVMYNIHQAPYKRDDFLQMILGGEGLKTSLLEDLIKRRFLNPKKELQTKPHIILIGVDSLSSKFLETPYLPFLNELSQKEFFFPNFYYHYASSFNAYVSLLFGVPAFDLLFEERLRHSVLKKRESLMGILSQLGYRSTFLTPSSNDLYPSMWNLFLQHNGHKIVGPQHFKDSLVKNQMIQVSDHDLANQALLEMQKHKRQPLFIKILFNALHFGEGILGAVSVSKRHLAYRNCVLSKDSIYSIKMQRGLCYTDFVIKDFVERASQTLGQNLIVVITAEHRSWSPISYDQNSLQTMHIPLFIIDKRGLIPSRQVEKVGSHQDIATTLLYMIGYEGDFSFLGKNLLSSEQESGFAVFSDHHLFYFRKGEYLLEINSDIPDRSFLFKVDKNQIKFKVDNPSLKERFEQEFKNYKIGVSRFIISGS